MSERDEAAGVRRLWAELAAVREGELHYRTLAEASQDYIFIIGRDDTVRYVNPAGAALLGRRPEEVIGRRRAELFPPQVAERQTANLQRVFETGRPVAAEDRTAFPGGERWLDSRLIPITDGDGQVTAVAGYSRDITARKEAERELEGARASLEEGVAARTAELTRANASLRTEVAARAEAEGRQRRLTGGLRAVIAAAGELARSADADTLCRKAVELARGRLGLERCSIFLDEGDHLRGTYGTNLEGETTDEHACRIDKNAQWRRRFERFEPGGARYLLFHGPRQEWTGQGLREIGEGWFAFTPIESDEALLGAFYNDGDITGAASDKLTQELVAVYGSAVGSVLERQRAEDAVRAASAQAAEFAAIVNRSPAIVFRWRVAEGWPVEFVSDTIRQLGYTPDDLLSGRVSWPGITHPEDIPRLEAEVGGYLRDGAEEFSQQYRLRTAWGEWRWVEDRNLVIRDQDGAITHIQGIALDITERQRAEEALRQARDELERRVADRTAALAASEERYRTLIDGIPDGVYRTDREGRFLYVNDEAVRRSGRPREWFLSHSIFDLTPPERREEVSAVLEAALRGERPGPYEFAYPSVSGEMRYVEVNPAPVREGGEVVGIMGTSRDVTERKRAQEALRASEERYRAVVEASPDAVMVTDLEGRITEVSDRVVELLGVEEPEALLGRNGLELIAPEDRDKADKGVVQVIAERGPRQIEYTLVRPDGSRFVAETRVALISDAHGRPSAVVAIARDVTERKRAQAALRASEEQYRALVQASPDAVVVTDLESAITEVSSRMLELYGYEQAEAMLGMSAYDLIAPEAREDAAQRFEDVEIQGKVVRNFELPLVRRDGSEFIGEVNVALVRDGQGRPTAFVGTVRDVTERKQAEQMLRLSERQYRSTVNAMSDAIHVLDRDLRILLHNRVLAEWCERLALSQDIRGRTIREAFGFLHHRVTEEYRRVFETGEPVVTEETHWLGGREVVTETRKVPVFEGDEVVRVVTLIRDITERRRAEEEMRRAERLESLGVLAGGIAHDFSNLLTGILGSLARARKSLLDTPQMAESLRDAEQAAQRARGITQQLLALSTGGAPIKAVASIGGMIRETAEFALSGSNCRCQLDVAPDLWAVEADVGQLNQVVQNLVINADQAMPDGGVIEVAARNVGPDEPSPLHGSRHVEIEVRDHGVGIPARDRPHIFDPYFTTKEAGSGLGLAVAHSIVHKHDGRIRVGSEIGAGSTFRVYLPASGAEPVARAEAIAPAERRPGRILIMDDEAIVRKSARWLLADLGYEVACASDGARAVELYQAALDDGEPFDVAVLDLTVPGGMGGQECLQRLRAIDPDVTAIVCSGYSAEPTMADFRRHGFRGIIVKPFELEGLDAELQRLLAPDDGQSGAEPSRRAGV